MTLIEKMLHSPKLPQYMRELKEILDEEKQRRRQFLHSLREDQKAEFINGEVVVSRRLLWNTKALPPIS